MTERQQADFERYMHIVPHKIAKYTPEFIGNEDFEQDCYLHLAEYLTKSTVLNSIDEQYLRGQRIHRNLINFVRQHAKQWSNDPLLVLSKSDNIDPYHHVRQTEIHAAVNEAIQLLPTKSQQTVIQLRFGFVTGYPMTMDAAGSIIQRTKSRVQQIENKSIRILRNRNYKAGHRIQDTISIERKRIYEKTRFGKTRPKIVIIPIYD